MNRPLDFIEIARQPVRYRPIASRVRDFDEVAVPPPGDVVAEQARRCMACGIPFCTSGCPLGNLVPEWNALVSADDWHRAWLRLRATNNFPEFTGRICPAPCESACVAGIPADPVTIEQIELAIVERAWSAGWVVPQPPAVRTGFSVAVVGSGPSGLAASDQLNRAGHRVTVFERHERPGGLLRFGIPDFKLDKAVLDRRIRLMEEEGIAFRCGVEVRESADLAGFDAVVLCAGSTRPRDLPVPGRDLDGIHFAWDFLAGQNRAVALGEAARVPISAAGRHVVVIGGGDTGSDCVGTANRQGAASVTQFELMPMPPAERPSGQPWPFMPVVMKTTSSHEEGAHRRWAVMTEGFEGDGRVRSLRTADVAFEGRRPVRIDGTERRWTADLVLLAMGYVGAEASLAEAFGLDLDGGGRIATTDFATSRGGVFSAGDMRRGQSLVVWAIAEGRDAARKVDRYLAGSTDLPVRGEGDLPRVA
jgi:glutamate synthase (NADPH/NADH) small chain